jgi:hypothetical protein
MDSTLVAAIIGVVGALLGVALTRFFDLLERRAKHQQWLDEFRLPKQIDTLSTLYANTVDLEEHISKLPAFVVLYTIARHGPPPTSLPLVASALAQYKKSRSLAFIYLSEAGRNISADYEHHAHQALARTELAVDTYDDTSTLPRESVDALKEHVREAARLHKALIALLQQQLAATSVSTNG